LQWYVDEKPIVGATDSTIRVNIPGDYVCKATNRVGSVESSTVAVAVVSKEAPPTVKAEGHEAVDRYYQNHIVQAPPEIVARGPAARKAFYEAIKSGGGVLFHQSRLMVVGQDRVGKTTWVQATVDGKSPSSDATSSTDGIEFTLVKCNLEDPECRFEVPDPNNEMEVIERAQARFIARKIYEEDPDCKNKKTKEEKLIFPQQVVQDRENKEANKEKVTSVVQDQDVNYEEEQKQSPIVYPELTPRMRTLVAEELRKLQSADLETYDPTSEHYLLLRISDFAGQPMHYNSHVFFMSDTGVYAIIFDLTRNPDATAKVLVGHKGQEVIVDATVDTNIDYLKTWMTSIVNTKQSPQVDTVEVQLSTQPIIPLSPSVLFIGTKLDELYHRAGTETVIGRNSHIMDQHHKILDELTGSRRAISTNGATTKELPTSLPKDEELRRTAFHTRNAAHMDDNSMFFVDNYKTLHGSEQEFRAIRRKIVQKVMNQEETTRYLPFSWILLELELYNEKKIHWHLSETECEELAHKCNISPEHMKEVLTYFDKLGIVIYRPSSHLLSDTVIIDPDWLMRVFRSIIRIRNVPWNNTGEKSAWDEVSETGIISFTQIKRALEVDRLVKSSDELEFVMKLFQKFNLLTPYVQANSLVAQYKEGSLRVSQFVAPSLVKYNPPWKYFVPEKEINPLTAQVKPVFIRSVTGSIPDALYNQLVARCICQYPVCPEVYRYFSRIHVNERYDLLLFNCQPCQYDSCLPHELSEAHGTIMLSVMDTDTNSSADYKDVRNICQEVLQCVLWALDNIKSTGLNGLQFALETSLYQPVSSSTFKGLSGLCKRHQIKGCTSLYCYQQVFVECHDANKEKVISEAVSTWIAKDGLRNRPYPYYCQGCDYEREIHEGTQSLISLPKTIKRGEKVRLECKARLLDKQIEWRHKGKSLPKAQGFKHKIEKFTEEHTGIYTWKVTKEGDYAFCRPTPIALPKLLLSVNQKLRVEIGKTITMISDPRKRERGVVFGDPICLDFPCDITKIPPPTYQWYFQHHPIPAACQNVYKIKKVRDYHDGEYFCQIQVGEDFEDVKSYPVSLCVQDKSPPEQLDQLDDIRKSLELSQQQNEKAPDKVALLIGNSLYEHPVHKPLHLPAKDVHAMSCILRKFGFQTISLVDLRFSEMVKALELFYDLVKQGVHAIFYYAGHGFQARNHQYLMPVDADDKYDLRRAIRAEGIVYQLQQQGAGLSLVILDCCRIDIDWSQSKNGLPQYPEIGTAIIANCCCPGHEAFEEVDKSIYTDALVEAMKRSLASKEPTAIRSIIDEAEKQTKTRCEELREELRQKLHLKNMYPTHREVSGSEGRKISLSCPCDVSNEAHVMNKEKIRKLCHGLHKGVAKHISDEKGRKFLKVVIEYRRAFANTLIARCRLMSMQESQIQVSDMSAKFKLDSSDKTHVKESHGVDVSIESSWVEGELEEHDDEQLGTFGPCLKISGLQRVRTGALSLRLSVEVRFKMKVLPDGTPGYKSRTVEFTLEGLPLIAAARWNG
jgi:mucosa-associated lymphoid tissue lymphoma translocation protein 1